MLGERVHARSAQALRAGRRDQRALRAAASTPDARVADLTAGQRQRVEIIKCLRREPRDHRLRRADERAHAGRERAAVLGAAHGRRRGGPRGRALSPQARRDPARHRRGDDHARRAGRRSRGHRRRRPRSTLAQSMVGRPVSLRSEAAALGPRSTRVAERGEPTTPTPTTRWRRAPVVLEVARRRGARTATGAGCSTTCRSPCAPARSSGSPGSRATASGRSPTCCPASCRSTQARCSSRGRPWCATDKPGALGGAGVGVIPEDRHDSGCVLDMTVAENLVLADLGARSSAGACSTAGRWRTGRGS